MTTRLPDPLVPAGTVVDVSGFILDARRLLTSDLRKLASGDEFRAAALLWCEAWLQRPPASLPNDDGILAGLVGVSLRRWAALRRMALHGFVLCADGRLYHPILARLALRVGKGNYSSDLQAERARRGWDRRRAPDAGGMPPPMPPALPHGNATKPNLTEQEREKSNNLNGAVSASAEEMPDATPSAGGFAEFWAEFPLHTGRRAALLAYAQACTRAPHAVILEGARRYARSREGQDAQYTASPAKWLEGDRWSDEPPKRLSEAEKAAKRRANAAQIDHELEPKS